MNKLLEEDFYKNKIHPLLKRKGYHIQVIDSDMIPDLIIARNSKVLRAELKSVNKLKRFPFNPGWRIGQLSWIKDYLVSNPEGVCLILNYCGSTFFLPPQKTYTREDLTCQKEQYLRVFSTL